MRETWYVLETGAVADPADVAPDEKGALRHKSGVAVAMRNQTPVSRGVDDPKAERAKAAVKAPAQAFPAKDIKPAEPKSGYVTRETKAEK